jgi:hypothetical protein
MIEQLVKGISITPLKERRPGELVLITLNLANVMAIQGILRLNRDGVPFISWPARKTGEKDGRAVYEPWFRIASREESDVLLGLVMSKYQRLVDAAQTPATETPEVPPPSLMDDINRPDLHADNW